MSGDEPPEGEKPGVLVRLLATVTPGPIRRSFAIKFGLVLLVMAASIGVIGWVATEAIAAETEQNVENDFRSVATQESDLIEQWLERNRLAVTLHSGSEDWASDNAEDLNIALDAADAGLSPDVEYLHVVEWTGDEFVIAGSTQFDSPDGLPRPVTEVDRGWLNDRADKLVGDGGEAANFQVGDVHVEDTYEIGSLGHVGFLSPTSSRQGRFLLMEVRVADIKSSLQGSGEEQSLTQRGFTQVVNGQSHTVLIDGQTNGTRQLQQYTSSQDALEPVRRANELGNETGADRAEAGVIAEMDPNDIFDETYTVGYAPIEDSNWVVVTQAPRSEVFGFVQTIQDYGLLATIAAVLLIAITGTLLGYSTSRSIDRLTAKTEEMQEGDLDVTFYTPRVDNIGRLYAGFADMRDALKEQIDEAERSRKEAEVARAEAEEMATYLQEKAEEYSEIMQQCAAGDLTQRMTKDGEEESMDRIADEFNDMIEELEKTTGQLKSYVDEVEQAGAEVGQSANTVREASEQVADSIQKISDSSYDQKERLRDISETMDDLAARLESFATNHPQVDFGDSLDQIKEISANIEETAELSEETMAESENVAGAAEEQAAELNEVGERAHDLQRYAQPLRDILNRFETEAEHEFVFSVGPTGGTATPSVGDADDGDEAGDGASDEGQTGEGDGEE